MRPDARYHERPAVGLNAGHIIRWWGHDYLITRLVEVPSSGTIVLDLRPDQDEDAEPATVVVGRKALTYVRIDSITDPLRPS